MTKDKVVGKSSDDTDVMRLDQKLYLAIMAVSCYHCTYLLNILEEHREIMSYKKRNRGHHDRYDI